MAGLPSNLPAETRSVDVIVEFDQSDDMPRVWAVVHVEDVMVWLMQVDVVDVVHGGVPSLVKVVV